MFVCADDDDGCSCSSNRCDDDVCYDIGERPKPEGETENMGVGPLPALSHWDVKVGDKDGGEMMMMFITIFAGD